MAETKRSLFLIREVIRMSPTELMKIEMRNKQILKMIEKLEDEYERNNVLKDHLLEGELVSA